MGRRGFPRVDIRDAWELAGGEGGHLGEGYQVFRNQHLEACVCVCGWVVVGCGQAVEGLECPTRGWMCIQWTAQEVLHCLFLKGNKCH